MEVHCQNVFSQDVTTPGGTSNIGDGRRSVHTGSKDVEWNAAWIGSDGGTLDRAGGWVFDCVDGCGQFGLAGDDRLDPDIIGCVLSVGIPFPVGTQGIKVTVRSNVQPGRCAPCRCNNRAEIGEERAERERRRTGRRRYACRQERVGRWASDRERAKQRKLQNLLT